MDIPERKDQTICNVNASRDWSSSAARVYPGGTVDFFGGKNFWILTVKYWFN